MTGSALFNCPSQGQRNRCGLNLFWGVNNIQYTTLIMANNSSFSSLRRFFAMCKVLKWSTQPTATWIFAIRPWISFAQYSVSRMLLLDIAAAKQNNIHVLYHSWLTFGSYYLRLTFFKSLVISNSKPFTWICPSVIYYQLFWAPVILDCYPFPLRVRNSKVPTHLP